MAVFVLMGQSNMSGRAVAPSQLPSNPAAWLFGFDYRWKAATEPSHSHVNEVDVVANDGVPAYGPGTRFAVSLIGLEPSLAVGIVPCAKGGTFITDWTSNYSDQSLYGSCLKRTRAATTMGTVAGVLWMQGESEAEAATSGPANAWGGNFASLAAALRTDLGLPLPIIMAQISDTNGTYNATVKAQQAAAVAPFTAMVKTDDLAHMANTPAHLDTAGVDALGARLATLWDAMARPTTVVPPPPLPVTGVPNPVVHGTALTIAWNVQASAQGDVNDWIGIFRADEPKTVVDFVDYRRLNCTQGTGTQTPPPTAGSCAFTAPAPGNYLMGYVNHVSATLVVTATLTVS